MPTIMEPEEMIHEACKDFKFQHFKEQREEGRLRRMPDILPVCMQNILHSRKPEL